MKNDISLALQSIEGQPLPQQLQDRIEQHKQTVSSLAGSLLAGGQSVDEVKSTIAVVMDSFKEQLLRTLIALREDGHAG